MNARPRIWGCVLFGLIVLVYLPILRAPFLWDDSVMVTDNGMLRSAQGLRDFWITTRAVDPLPLTMTALWLQWQAWGNSPLGYHLVDVLFHALGTVVLWRTLICLRMTPQAAWVSAALFGLHPVCVASAGWISEQKNTLSFIFFLLSILIYFRNQKGSYALALICFLAALLSKGSTVVLPVLLLLLTAWRERQVTFKDIKKLTPFFGLALLGGLATIWIQNHKAINGASVANLPWMQRVAAAGWAVLLYGWHDLVPVKLMAIYPFPKVDHALDAWPLTVLAILFFVARRNRAALVALGCFVVALLPVLGFVDMYFLNYSRIADQWQYLALPAIVTLAVAAAGIWLPPQMRVGASVIFLGLAAFLTVERELVYRTEASFWRDAAEKNPAAWTAWNNLGNALEGDAAITAYERALEAKAEFPDAESNLGNALVKKNKIPDALVHLRKAVEEESARALFHFNYGTGLAASGDYTTAVVQYEEALRTEPNDAKTLNNLANAHFELKNYPAALEAAQRAQQVQPDMAEPYLNVGKAEGALERMDEARTAFDHFLQMRPDNAGAHFEYGTLLAMHGKMTDALPQFQAVVRLKPDEAAGHANLGNTYAALKQLPEAIAEFRSAVRLQPNDHQNAHNLAVALYEDSAVLAGNGQREKAIEQLREALRLVPNDPAITQRLNEFLRQ